MLNRPPLSYPDQPFHQFLRGSADAHPERIALEADGETYSYRELDGCVNAMARALLGLGVGPGSRVAVGLPNRAEWIIAVLAASTVGAAAVPVNPRWRPGELEHAVRLTSPIAVVADADAAARLDPFCSDMIRITTSPGAPAGWAGFWDLLYASPGLRPPPADIAWADHDVLLPFSSGTSGLPKAVRHTHGSLVAATVQWKAASFITDEDRLHFFLPLFHIYGVITVANALSAGARLSLSARFDLDSMLRTIERERITVGFGAAPIAAAMAGHPGLEGHDLSSLRYFVWAATPVDQAVADAVTRRTGIRWLHAYGATEAPVVLCNPVDRPERRRLDSPGPPVSDTRLKVVDLERRTEVADGSPGELLVRGPQVMAGYLPEEADSDAFEDGWLRTGDVVVAGPGGWVRVVDRAKEMLKVNAFQVAPAELESALRGHPAVADCVVYGVPDPRTGEAPRAAVVLLPDASPSEEELLAWLGRRIAGYKRVRAIRFVADIPRTASGKPLRRLVRDEEPSFHPDPMTST